jgi:hypothetical protein
MTAADAAVDGREALTIAPSLPCHGSTQPCGAAPADTDASRAAGILAARLPTEAALFCPSLIPTVLIVAIGVLAVRPDVAAAVYGKPWQARSIAYMRNGDKYEVMADEPRKMCGLKTGPRGGYITECPGARS